MDWRFGLGFDKDGRSCELSQRRYAPGFFVLDQLYTRCKFAQDTVLTESGKHNA